MKILLGSGIPCSLLLKICVEEGKLLRNILERGTKEWNNVERLIHGCFRVMILSLDFGERERERNCDEN
jgi:hypothetical protein